MSHQRTLRSLAVLILTFTIAPHAGADVPTSTRYPPAYAEWAMTKGLTTREAADLLGTVFKSPADRAYLASVRKSISAEDKKIKMREMVRRGDGYDITAPNGRKFTLAPTKTSFALNGKEIRFDGVGAERYVSSVAAALKTTFVVRLMREMNLMPDARANVLEFVGLAGAAAAVTAIRYVKGAPRSEARQIIEDNKTLIQMCENDRLKQEYVDSQSEFWFNLWRSQGLLRDDGADITEACQSFGPKVQATYEIDLHHAIPFDATELKELCAVRKRAIKCVRDLEQKHRMATPPPAEANATTGH